MSRSRDRFREQEPLREAGTDFAFAGTEVIDQSLQQLAAANQLEGFGVVGEGDKFIMPLFFPPGEKADEKEHLEKKNNEANANGEAKEGEVNANAENLSSELGHLLLAIAKKASADSTEVEIEIFDSLINTVDPDMIRERAKELARAWVGLEVEPTFVFRKIPQQTRTSNACGLYVIFNA